MNDSLEAFLKSVEPVQPTVENHQPEAHNDQPKDVKSILQEGAPSVPEKVEDSKAPNQVPLRALEEERHKRQDLERQLRELRQELEARPQEAIEQEAPVEFYEDPEGHFQNLKSTMEQQLLEQRISMSEMMMRSSHKDYDEKMNRFLDEAKNNPHLVEQMSKHAHPAQFVYDTAQKYMKMDAIQDLEGYKQSLSETLRREIEEELRAKYEGRSVRAQGLPNKSLSDIGSSAPQPAEKMVDVDAFINANAWKSR